MIQGAANHNRVLFGQAATVKKYAAFEWLLPAEAAIRERLGPLLAGGRMLDLGIGGGRTTFHFAPRVAEYHGIDYAPAMVEACRERFRGALPGAVFAEGDARALPPEWADGFDFVLFSYNGIDCLDREDRLKVFAEMARVMRPGAWMCFSAHNLNSFAGLREWTGRPGLLPKLRGGILYAKLRLLNPGLHGLLDSDHCLLRDGGTRGRGCAHYIRPAYQVRQLAGAGFTVRDLYAAREAAPFPDPRSAAESNEPWIYYLCQRTTAG